MQRMSELHVCVRYKAADHGLSAGCKCAVAHLLSANKST